MPDKPTWFGRLDEVIAALQALDSPWVDRPTLEALLGVRRRRAQQIMKPVITRMVGANGVADRTVLIDHLRRLATGDAAYYERQRRQRLARTLDELRRACLAQPPVPVEAPTKVIDTALDSLPPGVSLSPGAITVRFQSPDEALQKLLALAMAVGNDYDRFAQAVTARAAAASV